MEETSEPLTWRRSGRCGTGGCVEVAEVDDEIIAIRDSKDPASPVLRFSRVEWHAFVAGVRDGDFEFD